MEIMDINSLAKYVDIENVPEEWVYYYDKAYNSFDRKWLNIDLDDLFDYYQFDDSLRKRISLEFDSLKNDINLNFLVYLWYFIMFKSEDSYKIWRWKNEFSYFKSHGSFMMPVIAFLMFYKEHQQIMKKLDFDEEQIEAHKREIRLVCQNDAKRLGIDGIRFSQMVWASRFMKGHIIQVGVLQYELKKQCWNGEDVIFIHIPRNTDLSPELVEDSFRRSPELVKKYLQVEGLKYITETWLLSKDLVGIIKVDSNIKRFQQYFQVVEEISNTKDFLNFVFDEPFFEGDYEKLSETTSLQRGLKNKLLNGENLHICLGILK